MHARTRTLITLLGVGVGVGTAAQEAVAFRPVTRPWPSTPERIVATRRPDGTSAFTWLKQRSAPQNLSRAAASELALSLVRDMAPALAVSHVTELDGFTVVTIRNAHLGVPVERSFLSVVFKEGSPALVKNELLLPSIQKIAPRAAPEHAEARALEEALAWNEGSTLASRAELVFWAPGDHPEELRLAYKVHTRSQHPRSELDFFFDADTLELLAADEQVRFADGEGRVRLAIDPVAADDPEVPFSTKFIELAGAATDNDGETLQSGPVTLTYDGPYVRVNDQSGTPLETFQLDFSGPYRTYDFAPTILSQADPFVHLNLMKSFARTITPTLQWLDQRLTANVNINDNCNAFWDGQTVNFFRTGNGCNNTARVSSIVYHEFGHGYHQFLTDNIVGSVGEGTGDFLASTLLSDPIVGRGFSTTGAGIRRIDDDRRFPEDYVGEVHEDGLIWASALWDLRDVMIEKHGEWRGRILTDRLFIFALAQGPGLSTAYPAMIAADDDDQDPSNGTPNSCEINAIWDAHGMINSGQIAHTPAGVRAFVRINHDAPGRFVAAQDGSISVRATYENRSACGDFDPSTLTLFWAPDAEGGVFSAIPMIPDGAASTATINGLTPGQTFRYYFELSIPEATFRNGSAAQPHVGALDRGQRDVTREDFEAGIGAWTHGTIGSDLVDDWDVAAPHGQYFDPFAAHSGVNVAGTDLGLGGGPDGTDGAAKAGRRTFLESGPMSATGVQELELELWHQFAIDGTLVLFVDGQEVWKRTIANDWSGGWRYASVRLPDALIDRATPFTVRFEVETSATNGLGGWSIDDVAITGVEIPPPPPAPDDPPDDPPPDNPPDKPPTDDPGQVPTDPMDPPSGDPSMDPAQIGGDGFSRRGIAGGCVCATSRDGSSMALLLALLGVAFILRRR